MLSQRFLLSLIRIAISEDDGQSWSPLKQVGDWGGIVVMGSVVSLKTSGHYLAMFHDDGRFFKKDGERTGIFTLYQTNSVDGGLTWSEPKGIYANVDIHLCEPGINNDQPFYTRGIDDSMDCRHFFTGRPIPRYRQSI